MRQYKPHNVLHPIENYYTWKKSANYDTQQKGTVKINRSINGKNFRNRRQGLQKSIKHIFKILKKNMNKDTNEKHKKVIKWKFQRRKIQYLWGKFHWTILTSGPMPQKKYQ